MTETLGKPVEQHKQQGIVRTDMHCHACNKYFLAELDYDIDGQHSILCPHCNHKHMRYIKNGFVSDQRWDSDNEPSMVVENRRVWKHSSLEMKTTVTSEFIRNRWLNFNK